MIRKNTRGFTLIEMSIVLVIIGLIVGGILVGQNLVDAAAIRAQVAQIEKFNQAVNTFHDKYGYLPGDITPAAASPFGLMASTGATADGDGNGLMESCSAWDNDTQNFGCETMLFWVHLSQAGLIAESFGNMGAPDSGAVENIIPSNGQPLIDFFPAAKLNGAAGNYIVVYTGGIFSGYYFNNSGYNYFGITVLTSVGNGGEYTGQSAAALTPHQAYAIDSKMDDGLPFTGTVTSVFLWNRRFLVSDYGVADNCATFIASHGYVSGGQYLNTYNINSAVDMDTPQCNLSFQFQ
jgi:prepilin-type N-terminal cleavage/methylation domain-containing protein